MLYYYYDDYDYYSMTSTLKRRYVITGSIGKYSMGSLRALFLETSVLTRSHIMKPIR